ncbi:MAG: hypothetical protein K2X99_10935 [Gemmatimonadaceae bacterium]|nr:hypothetical protein [Gemmatimonadaceae bacterium]
MTSEEKTELHRLRRENPRLKVERDILGKAAAGCRRFTSCRGLRVPRRLASRVRRAGEPDDEALPPLLRWLVDLLAEESGRNPGFSQRLGVRVWLRAQPVSALRAIIQSQDLDPTRRTAKWQEPEKLAGYIVDGLRPRLTRGSSFMAAGRTDEQGKVE